MLRRFVDTFISRWLSTSVYLKSTLVLNRYLRSNYVGVKRVNNERSAPLTLWDTADQIWYPLNVRIVLDQCVMCIIINWVNNTLNQNYLNMLGRLVDHYWHLFIWRAYCIWMYFNKYFWSRIFFYCTWSTFIITN